MTATTAVLSAKVPVDLAARVGASSRADGLTPSRWLRALVEREMGAESEPRTGRVVAAVSERLAELANADADPRAAVCLELARRLDRDPANAAGNARELDRLLSVLEARTRDVDDPIAAAAHIPDAPFDPRDL